MSHAPTNETINLQVGGMTCAACQIHVRKALEKTPGVSEAAVNLMSGEATVVFDPSQVAVDALLDGEPRRFLPEDAGGHGEAGGSTSAGGPGTVLVPGGAVQLVLEERVARARLQREEGEGIVGGRADEGGILKRSPDDPAP